jgi:hypothetical protein
MDVAFSLSDPHRHYPAIAPLLAQTDGDRPRAAGRFWAIQSEKMKDFLSTHPDDCLLVRYESLTEQPEETLRPLFDWLAEPWEPEVLDYNRKPHHKGYEDPDVRRRTDIVANSGNHKKWPPEVQAKVLAECGSMLQYFGYV